MKSYSKLESSLVSFIFLSFILIYKIADRHEKVERALQKIGLLPKEDDEKDPNKQIQEEFQIEEVDLEFLETKLQDKEVLTQIYKYIQSDDDDYEF